MQTVLRGTFGTLKGESTMKKNKMLRMASVLLILVMLTTSIVGGTFAKYTTTGTASDTARVAKWGVSITTENDGIFASTYEKATTSTELTATNSVVAATVGGTQDKVVAPGTTGSATFTISGTPEVAFKLTASVKDTNAIKVATGTEITMNGVKVKPTADYEPITFKIEKQTGPDTWSLVKIDTTSGKIAESGNNAEDLTLAELKTALESLNDVYEANATVSTAYKITWTWPFETTFNSWSNDTGFDATYTDADILDTYLGNETTAQQEKFSISITATQID